MLGGESQLFHKLLWNSTLSLISFRVADCNAQAEFISAEHKTVSFERVFREERICFIPKPPSMNDERSESFIENF